jgi:hypothetical protein
MRIASFLELKAQYDMQQQTHQSWLTRPVEKAKQSIGISAVQCGVLKPSFLAVTRPCHSATHE